MSLFLAVLKEIGQQDGARGAAGAIKSHYIFTTGATIGRHHDNTVILQNPSLSRFHARIDYQNDKFYKNNLAKTA